MDKLSPLYVSILSLVSILLGTLLILKERYDDILRMRDSRLTETANQAQGLVDSIFPSLVHDRLYENQEEGALCETYQNTTVLFIDVVGFCAWCSEREPIAIFRLLETLFGRFDELAKAMDVFKVETVGDGYMAATGLPTPRPDHAEVMAQFAEACRKECSIICKRLARTLGPGTSDLRLRLGMHSGPVVGGILRGDRTRFQLFGDTVNIASRLERNGKPNKIHMSSTTAALISECGHPDWITPRKNLVVSLGKCRIQTYWCHPKDTSVAPLMASSSSSLSLSDDRSDRHNASDDEGDPLTFWGHASVGDSMDVPEGQSERLQGLIDWNSELLIQLLRNVVRRRIHKESNLANMPLENQAEESDPDEDSYHQQCEHGILDQIAEVISFDDFNMEAELADDDDHHHHAPYAPDVLSDVVKAQVREFVSDIAAGYNTEVPFHNFEHASHVMLSVCKLLNRIKEPNTVKFHYRDDEGRTPKSNKGTRVQQKRSIHEQTFGISSDPLLHYAIAVSALVHDMGHHGVSNKQLVRRQTPEAIKYEGRCVAEQNSISLSRDVFMAPKFAELRACIFGNSAETIQRYQQFKFNTVLATDIADSELRQMRQDRWTKVFGQGDDVLPSSSESSFCSMTAKEVSDRKATIVVDYIIQASDIAHTMQHWEVFLRWNRRLFREMYKAFMSGESDEDPRQGWYKGEIGFFDFYVIPLATKLWDCGVFGVCGDEYLNYAKENRRLWEEQGEQLVADMLEECEREYPAQPQSPFE